MQFGNPAMLLGLLVVAIPIVIALLHRQRHREVRWAAMAFLEAALRKNRRRLTFQNLLLLLLRTGILLLLVLALARPFLKESNILTQIAPTQRRIVVLLDRSFSMGYRAGTELSSLDRGKEAVAELLRDYAKTGDQLRVFFLDETAEGLYADPQTLDAATKEKVLGEVAGLEPSHYGTDISLALRSVLEVLKEKEEGGLPSAGQTEIFLITDLQRNGWVRENGLRDAGLSGSLRRFGKAKGVLHLVDVGSEGSENVAVQVFAPTDPIITPSAPVQFDAVVRSYSGTDRPDVEVSLIVDGQVRKALSQDVPGGKQSTFSFHHIFTKAGSHSVTARLAADNLAVDNERNLAVEVREQVPVLIVDGNLQEGVWQSESDFLALALSPTGGDAPGERPFLEVTVISEADLRGETLGGYAVVFLANVASLADDQVKALEGYVSAGGGLFVSLGDQIDPEFYRRYLYRDGTGLLPAAPGEIQGDPEGDVEEVMGLARADTSHTALAFFLPRERFVALGRAYFWQAYSLTAVAPEARRLLYLRSRDREVPVLLERNFGRGRVMLWTSTIDDGWTAFPKGEWTYVALMQLVTFYLADAAYMGKNLIVGDPYEQVLDASEYSDSVMLITPGRETIPKPLSPDPEGGGRFRLTHEVCPEAGIYSILFSQGETGGAREEFFAVNVRTEESNLSPIGFDELRDLLPGAPLRYTPFDQVGALTKGVGEAGGAGGIWKLLLVALVAFVALETFLARWLGR